MAESRGQEVHLLNLRGSLDPELEKKVEQETFLARGLGGRKEAWGGKGDRATCRRGLQEGHRDQGPGLHE